jgi:Zn-dependent peptidase ImmA (M78 family)
VSSRELDKITAELNLRLMHLDRFLESVEFSGRNDIPRLDVEEYGDIETIAGIVRSHWGVPRGPIRDLTMLVERAGVIVAYSTMGGADVSGVTFRAPGKPPIILLNQSNPADRLRFTLAHELGHLVMHRFPTPDMEREANQFASAFLMPKRDILHSFAGKRITLNLLASLKPEWKVAMQALLMRAKSVGCLTSNQERYLWQQISKRGWRLREPADLDFPREEPSVLSLILRTHMNDLGYTVGELANITNLYPEEFMSLYGVGGQEGAKAPHMRIIK